MTSSNRLKSVVSCHNELQQELGFKDNHPLVLCIRCLRFINRNRFGRSIYNKDLKICCNCCNEEKSMQDKDWIEDLENMRKEGGNGDSSQQ
jgi:hypothetical protein